MSDSVIRQFAIDIERHREVLEVLVKKCSGNSIAIGFLFGCIAINAIERRLLENEVKKLNTKITKNSTIEM